ncbi:amidohydrolase [Phytoactinopolyspora limicola]|uniref:amidohydrolase n=1 Tax=Phytoactinopolyspora limicola TaxID=2715536 RepID=UPI001407D9CC|nr:amidohydrolase [Phytoactinopolyspora limicola]
MMTGSLFAGGLIRPAAGAERVEALAAVNGTVLMAGTLQACRTALVPFRYDEIDLSGGTMLPGFVDAHAHPLLFGMRAAWADVSPGRVASIDELVRVLCEHAARLPPDVPIRAFGYHQDHLAERRHPTAADLDRVATDRPVDVMHTSGHGFVVNRHRLRTLGVDRHRPSPPGGQIGRDGDGEPDGRLWDAACDLITGDDGIKVTNHGPNLHLPQSESDILAGAELAQAELLRAGITTVGDAQATGKELSAYIRLHNRGRLRLRVHAYVLSSLLDQLEVLGLAGPLGDAWLRVLGVKLYADGSLTAGTAYLPGGYTDLCHQGHLYHEPDELRLLVDRVHRMGLQAAIHAQGTVAIELVLDAFAQAMNRSPRSDARHRIEHCGLPTPDQVRRMGELGVVPVGQPQHVTEYGDGVLAAIGERGHTYTPYGWFRDAGLPVVLSSDTPVVVPNPLAAVAAAVTRRTGRGTRMGADELRLTVADALRGYTMGGAYALRRDHDLGTLEPGKRADAVVLDQDPLSVAPEDLPDVRVRQTWVDGQVVASG